MNKAGSILQLTCAIFKPDITAHPHLVHEVKQIIQQRGFYLVQSREMFLSRKRAQDFYKEHEGRFFYDRLVNFMSSGPISTHILARENAILEWRKLMGPTKVSRTLYSEPYSIRGRYGSTDTRNATHGSDSEVTARNEIHFFFPEFDVDLWYREHERNFATGPVVFDTVRGIHVLRPELDQIEIETNQDETDV